MRWVSRWRPMAIGGLCLLMTLAASASLQPACAQAMQLTGFNALDPQWALASSYMSSSLNMADGISRQAYTAKFGSGTFGIFAASRDEGTTGFGIAGNPFGPLLAASYRQDWFAGPGDLAWNKSVFGTYKSAPNAALNGLYTTASFGMTSFTTNPMGFSGLPGFTAGNEAVGVTAKAGVGLQLTPQISIEGSVGVTQISGSGFR